MKQTTNTEVCNLRVGLQPPQQGWGGGGAEAKTDAAARGRHSAEGGRAARLSLLPSRKRLQAEKVLEKLEDRPAMSVEM